MNNLKRKVGDIPDNSDNRGPSSKKPKKEKREARFKQVCNKHTKNRIERAMNEHMYLIDRKEISETRREYTILGPAGSVYTIIITNTLSCNCPDFLKGFQCKHILFVLLKVLKVDRTSKLIYQKALKTKELESIFVNSPKINLPSKRFINELEETIISKKKRRKIGDKCPVCFDAMETREDLVWCQTGCGNNIHKDCFDRWKQTVPVVTCVVCRAVWKDITLPEHPPLRYMCCLPSSLERYYSPGTSSSSLDKN
ncbi:hypothetical protein Glove_365g255 [Diversispora epigaea]|uniref:SWIM-type domain-containing protein n=1 Tax=Diversispora epigaea TaxID=1348612 RepID=A0A397HC47_9GLOM|nr:hypothetical protein Glove_365g255 [Diversispora epigaea]